MALAAGQTLGHFEVLEQLGVGGMGEVYRARDLKLGREVALKTVRTDLAGDPDGLARFGREARLLAALNHPHIATLYDLEEADGVCCLVLELVPGPTLAEHLRGGPLSVCQACELARQIADALEAAHAKGIIHRDLKPGNIKLGERGQVKVLDFGLAKALHPTAAAEARVPVTVSFDQTGAGVILGTPAYMSPEQARGETVDARADVWAFGCVLFEMLTGQRAFAAPTPADTLVAILEREPDWSRLPADTPAPVRDTLQRCLRKDPARRLRDIRDVRVEIEEGSLRWSGATTLPVAARLPTAAPVDLPVAVPATSVLETIAPSQTLPPAPAGAAGAMAPATSASAAAATAAPPSSRKNATLIGLGVFLLIGGIVAFVIWQNARNDPMNAVREALEGDGNPFKLFNQMTEGFKPKDFFRQMEQFAPFGEQPGPSDDVAVLPFETPFDPFEGKEVSEHLAGLLTDLLGAGQGLRVTSQNKVQTQGPFYTDAQRLGRNLRAAAVLTGKITRQGGELQVRVELVESATGTRLGGNAFVLSSTQRAALQVLARDIAADVLPRLRPTK